VIITTQKKICISIEEKTVSGISAAAAKRGVPLSQIAQIYLERGLSRDVELTGAERFYFQRDNIERSLNNILTIFGIDMKGSLSDKFQTLMVLCTAKSRQKNRTIRYGIIETSLFEVLNNLKDMDKNLFDEWCVEMGKYGRIRNRYFNLYPKLSKKSMT
jgi:hypothetical protein